MSSAPIPVRTGQCPQNPVRTCLLRSRSAA